MPSHHRPTLTALLCLALAAAGCAGDPERSEDAQAIADTINVVFHHGNWRQIPATPANQAEAVVFEQRVAFQPQTALLDAAGSAAIDRLLAEAEPQPGNLVRLSVPASGGEETYDRMTLQRLESVRAALANRGYDSALADTAVARVEVLGDHEIGLTVTRIMAVLPDCDQPQPLEPDPPQFERGFGCSNTYNLGVMVANPADLEHGRPLDPADAERASLTVQRYRVDDPVLDSLLLEDTKSQNPEVQ